MKTINSACQQACLLHVQQVSVLHLYLHSIYLLMTKFPKHLKHCWNGPATLYYTTHFTLVPVVTDEYHIPILSSEYQVDNQPFA